MLESVLSAVVLIGAPEVDTFLEEGFQVVEVTIARPARDLVSSTGELEAVMVQYCDGRDEVIDVLYEDEELDYVEGFGLVLNPQDRVCGVGVLFGRIEIEGNTPRGPFVLDARPRPARISLRRGRGSREIRRFREIQGRLPDPVPPRIRVQTLLGDPQ